MQVHGVVAMPDQSASVPQPRLVEAAHEFEAQMMKELLRPMARTNGMDGDEADAGSGGALADFATEALGQSLSKSGGLGIARCILQSLSHSETASQPSAEEGTPAGVYEMVQTCSSEFPECR
jgi:Rod binding domain-containing protein